jgi:translation initiation factor 2 alpha subunit (eIF-2alpha)
MSQEKLTNVDTRLQNVETQVLTVNELAKDVDVSLAKVDKDLDILTDGC